jgi:large subunit ribosomal protein L13
MLEGRFPERVLEKAVERMIPRGPLGRQQMRNLRIYKPAPSIRMKGRAPKSSTSPAMNRKNKVGA